MIKKGRGLAVALYPTGFAMGGDVSHAIIKVLSDGSINVYFGTGDLGQGIQTILAQIVAEEFGVPYNQVKVYNRDTEIAPFSNGAIASRGTYSDTYAIDQAVNEVKSILIKAFSKKTGLSEEELEFADGAIFSQKNSDIMISFCDIVWEAIHVQGHAVIGKGSFIGEISIPDCNTGACNPFRTLAWAAILVDVDVDTNTGVVKITKLTSVYDAGKIINPSLVRGQIIGGTVMGLGASIMEELYPYYPALEWQGGSFGDYIIPVTTDLPEMDVETIECPSNGHPYGVKGVGEMTPNVVMPAVVNAVYDAIGIRFNTIPLTPSRVLAEIEKQSSI